MTNDQLTAVRRDFGSLRLRGRIWWIRYRVDGKEHWESSKSESRLKAEKLLSRRQAELGAGILTAPDVRRVSFGDLEGLLLTHYKKEGNRSTDRVEYGWAHLREAFGSMRAVAITSDRIASYEADRLEAGASRSTINYELALLRKAFNLAVRLGKLASAPSISTPDPRNARTGFFEEDDFQRVHAALHEHLKPVMEFAYFTGWRVQSEVLPLTWARVDFNAGVVRLDPNTTKNTEGRTFPFDVLPSLEILLSAQRELTNRVERETGRIIPQVFHRNGKEIRSYRHGWQAACERAAKGTSANGLTVVSHPHLRDMIVHDLRRTAVRNLVRAGVPETTAMKLTGHKTREVFDRYDIVDENDLRYGVEKLAAHLSAQRAKRTG